MINTLDAMSKTYDFDLVITSANDSKHMDGSKHYKDEAIDIRSHYFKTIEEKETFRYLYESRLNFGLNNKFRVLLENVGLPEEHFHAQVKRGQKYP